MYVCREGLARFCTEAYEEPSSKNMHKSMAHLTNYSLNKKSENFEHCGETLEAVFDPNSSASKRPLTSVLKQLEAEFPEFSSHTFYQDVTALARTTAAAMAPVLMAYFRGTGSGDNMPCAHILGYDVMLDRDFKVYLLEVNNSPSMSVDEALPLDASDPQSLHPACKPWRPREKEGKVCTCLDMAQPHYHQKALVDLAVKTTAVVGLFRILEKLRQGDREPEVDSYISVDVSGHSLYTLLQGVEALFARVGPLKAFSSAGLRRALGSVCGHGRLEKHDLDALSWRFRGTAYISAERGVKPDALRLFDYVDALRQVAARAFPHEPPAAGIAAVLDAAGA